MIKAFLGRLKQGHRTTTFPAGPAPALSERFRGLPAFNKSGCDGDCGPCVAACPTGALSGEGPRIDLGRCLFCGQCAQKCPGISFTREYRLATRRREDLICGKGAYSLASPLDEPLRGLLGR